MDQYIKILSEKWANKDITRGIMLIENRNLHTPHTDIFDRALLIFIKNPKRTWFVESYQYEKEKVSVYIITTLQLEEWVLNGVNKKIFTWLFNGEILYDRNNYLQQYIQELADFPFHERKVKLGLEFAKLLRCYLDGKSFYEQKQYLDAYTHIIHSLHHLGRLAVIEKGYHPETTVWNQVKQIEPEIYKMYEELINNQEELSKRLKLLFLASEFFIHQKTELGSAHLLEVLQEKERWSLQEILQHPELSIYSLDLMIIIEYLVDKNYLDVQVDSIDGDMKMRYFTNGK